MLTIGKILVPVDFSEPSRNAVTYGLTLAKQFNAKLILAHIVPESSALQYTFPTEAPRVEMEQEEKARLAIQDLISAKAVGGVYDRAETIVKTGTIDGELLEIVEKEGVQLVVMGTHGRRKLSRWFIGSVTEHMLRALPVPVLTVSHVDTELHPIGLVSLKRILYATDLFESTTAGLQYAIDLSRGAGAQLTIAHVIHYPDRKLWAPGGIATFEEERAASIEEIKKKTETVFSKAHIPEFPIDSIVVQGRPFEKILEIAAEQRSDIIVINLQSKSTLERAFLGSTAERVVRLSPIPVLSIPMIYSVQ